MTSLEPRAGARPVTTTSIPHSQVDQQPADSRFLDRLLTQASRWPGVELGPSGISVEGARALTLSDAHPGAPSGAPAEAFMVGREFCHGHAQGDFSLHLTLPVAMAKAGEQSGWLEPHFLVLAGQLPPTHVMLYAPRDEEEASVALELVRASYQFALGNRAEAPTVTPA